jgi:predicted PolB exonuclease-like 3'-5' exonuclease
MPWPLTKGNMKKKIKSMQLHDVMFVGGVVGQIKNTVDEKNHPGFEYSLNKTETLVECKYRGQCFDIPVVNCKNIVYDWIEDVAPKAVKV